MGDPVAIMQVCAPFSALTGYGQVNGNPAANVTLLTRDAAA